MNHQPFEKLLLDEKQRTLQEEQDLWAHLKECNGCQKIDTNWQAVKQQIKPTSMVSPQPGFTARWNTYKTARLAQKRQQRQTLVTTLLILAAIITMMVGISVWYSVTSPAGLLVVLARGMALVVQLVTLTPQDVISWIASMPVIIPIVAGMGLLGWVAAVGLTGVATLWRISVKGVVLQ